MQANDTRPATADNIVDFVGRAARLTGSAGSGKTSALVRRAVRLASEGRRVLFLTAPSARSSTMDAVLHAVPALSPLVRVTTWHGLARSVMAAEHLELQFLGAAGRREVVALLLGRAADSLAVTRTTTAIMALRASGLQRNQIVAHANAAGVADRWTELADLSERYENHLRAQYFVDAVGAMVAATLALRDPVVRTRLAYDDVIVDDHESATFAEHRLLTTIVSPTDPAVRSLVVAGNPNGPRFGGAWNARWLQFANRDFELDVVPPPRTTAWPLTDAVRVHHRSVVGDAVVGEVQQLMSAGMRADEIAIVVAPGATSTGAVRGAARRHGLPIAAPGRRCGDDPVVAAVAELLRFDAARRATAPTTDVRGTTGTSAVRSGAPSAPQADAMHRDEALAWPAAAARLGLTAEWHARLQAPLPLDHLAFEAWIAIAPRLLGVQVASAAHPAIAAIRTFIDALAASASETQTAHEPSPNDAAARIDAALNAITPPGRGVAVVDDSGTRGRRWRAVIITGCEEGVRPPRPDAVVPYYDLDLLDGPDVADVTERHRRAAADARTQFDFVCSRATERVIAIASPEPGVLMSRFLETIVARVPHLPHTTQRPLTAIATTKTDRPFRSGPIRASASSLETFQNCPLQFTIRYVLGVDTPSGVQAAVGTLVHEILEKFLDPKINGPRTRERLAEILDDMWTDDLFTYRAQAAEYRSRVATMLLSTWFEREAAAATDVARVEHRFEIAVAGHTLSGFIDRVDRHPASGDGPDELEVIDYKTGSWKTGKAGEENLQLGTYYLAAKRDPELVALGEPTRLRLHFVDAGKDAWQTIGPDHEAMWETAIAEALVGIEGEEYEPAPEAECEYCDYQRLCPIQREGRLVPLMPATQAKP